MKKMLQVFEICSERIDIIAESLKLNLFAAMLIPKAIYWSFIDAVNSRKDYLEPMIRKESPTLMRMFSLEEE